MCDHIVVFRNHFTGHWVENTLSGKTAVNTAANGLTGNIIRLADPYTFVCTAVVFVDDDVLCNIHETAGQVTCICRTESCISETLTSAVCGNEVFLRCEAFAEV